MNFWMARDTNEIDMKCISKLCPPYFLLNYIIIIGLYILFIVKVVFTYHGANKSHMPCICMLFGCHNLIVTYLLLDKIEYCEFQQNKYLA